MYHPISVSPKGFPVEHIMIIMDWRLWSSQISSFPPSGAQQEPICSAKLSHWDDWRTTAPREHQPWNPGPENMNDLATNKGFTEISLVKTGFESNVESAQLACLKWWQNAQSKPCLHLSQLLNDVVNFEGFVWTLAVIALEPNANT